MAKQPAPSAPDQRSDTRLDLREISHLTPYARNSRTHDAAQVSAIAASIDEFGFIGAIVIRDGTIAKGHGTLAAVQQLAAAGKPIYPAPGKRAGVEPFQDGMIPVQDCSGWTETQFRAYVIADNRLAEQAGWDRDMLALEVSDLGVLDFDLELLGFDAGELEGLLSSGDAAQTEGDTEPQIDRAEGLRVLWGVETGQLWALGGHRLLCGDSTRADDVARVMGGERADLCFTSPPYGQQRDYRDGGAVTDWDALMQGVFGNLPMVDAGQVLVNLGLIHKDGEWLPYWDGWIEWMRAQGWRRFGWYVWDQLSGFPGNFGGRCAPCFEFIFHFNRQSVQANKTIKTKCEGGKRRSGSMGANGWIENGERREIESHKIPDAIWRVARGFDSEIDHPAKFRVGLPTIAIETWTSGTVYEPFSGSGTTIIAGENLGRRVRAIEISAAYCSVALQRWADHTGKTPVLLP